LCSRTYAGFAMAVVLIIEDEDHLRALAETYLHEQGHDILSAGTRDGAVALLKSPRQIDLLFTDLTLHGDLQAGIDIARQAVERRPDLKVLYTTGSAVTAGMRTRFVEGSTVLPKPYTVEQLLSILARHFGIGRPQRARPLPRRAAS